MQYKQQWICYEMQVNMVIYKIARKKAEVKIEMRRLFWDGYVEESKGMMIQALVASEEFKHLSQHQFNSVQSLSHVWLFTTPWTVAYQASLFMGFSRQK